jgi:hypothetical protein
LSGNKHEAAASQIFVKDLPVALKDETPEVLQPGDGMDVIFGQHELRVPDHSEVQGFEPGTTVRKLRNLYGAEGHS